MIFATLGSYLGCQLVVLASLRARMRGWVPSGTFSLGRWGIPMTVAALSCAQRRHRGGPDREQPARHPGPGPSMR